MGFLHDAWHDAKDRAERITKAETGEAYRWKEYTGTKHEAPVLAPCANKTNGRWACMTHGKDFDNQLQKDSHISRGKHRLVWICFEHGPEKP